MGLFDWVKRTVDLAAADYNGATGYPVPSITSGLFTPSTLAKAVFPDLDQSLLPVSEAEALSCPAVARGIQILCSVASRLPLNASGRVPWLAETSGAITPAKRTASLVQDLVFHGAAVLAVDRDGAGSVTAAEHLPRHLWSVDAEGYILVNGEKVRQDTLVYIPSLMPLGFLDYGKDAVRQYRNIAATINNRSAAPEPVVIVEETEEVGATETEVDEAIDSLTTALQSRRGGIVYQPKGLNFRGFGATDSANAMMLQAREALRKDLANFLGITVGLLDGTNGDSNTYNNAVDERNELLELSLKTWTEPIADRLSQDDVTPTGVKVSFDYSTFKTDVSRGNTETSEVTE